MAPPVICVGPGQSVDECMAVMAEKHIRHLPVMDGDELAGMVPIGDLVENVIAERPSTIERLEHGIHGQQELTGQRPQKA